MTEDPYRYFRVEARELVDELVKGALDLEHGAPASQVVPGLLRHAHTLKGAARVVNQPEIADASHAVEDALEPSRDASGAVPGDRVEIVLELLDGIAHRVAGLAAEPVDPAATARPAVEGPLRTVRTDVGEMDALLDGVGEAHASLRALRGDIDGARRARGLVDLVAQLLASPRTHALEPAGRGVATERARSVAGELRDVLAAMEQGVGRCVEQIDRELQQVRDTVERLRLVPAAALFTDLDRAARDVARAQGKRVVFDGRGGDVRLDAHLVAAAQSALQQIVRNAVAHGIETPEGRRAATKPPDGRVTVDVARRGRRAVFTCHDDGQGIDLAAVRHAARRKGLVSPGTDALGPEELMRLLLRGGISTSGTVTELSGRGIGLDVASDSAARLGGEITVTTEAGKGTTVELVAPLSLSAFEALAVQAPGVTASIPLDAIRGTRRVTADDIAAAPEGQSLAYDGRIIPFVSLPAVVAGRSAPERAGRPWSVVVVEGGSGVVALGVQRLLGTSSIVVRPLPDLAPPSTVVSGVWIDAEGGLQLVLDPDGLVGEAQRRRDRSEETATTHPPILVIDDSLTTRMLEQSILESAGYEVEVAVSGEEALRKAQTRRYALFLVDVEMPGMDGFSFIEQAKATAALRDVPCILVTSRSSPEDRRRGFDVGAVAYMAKSDFDQGQLLERIHDLVGRVAGQP